jgi:hypothetical protein
MALFAALQAIARRHASGTGMRCHPGHPGTVMTTPDIPSLTLVPGRHRVLFVVRVDRAVSSLTVHAAHFFEGLKAACAMLSFTGLEREEERLDELLPWTGNV